MTLYGILDQLFFGPAAWASGAAWLAWLLWSVRGEQNRLEAIRGRLEESSLALNFLVQIAIAVVLLIVSYLLAPRPKAPQPAATKDFEAPTAEAGRPIPVVFGTKTVKGGNVLWYGDKRTLIHKVSA